MIYNMLGGPTNQDQARACCGTQATDQWTADTQKWSVEKRGYFKRN